MGKTTQRDTSETKKKLKYTDEPKKKLKPTQKMLFDDDDDDVEDPRQEHCELVENVSSMSDSSLDDDDDVDDDHDAAAAAADDDDATAAAAADDDDDAADDDNVADDDDDDDGGGGDDDVELLDPKQEQHELVENVSTMSDSSLDDDDHNHDHDAGAGAGAVADDDDADVELLDPKQEPDELVETVSPMSDFLEKYSSFESGVVYVRGYKVQLANVTILEAIFKKHGDIAANCVFKASSTRTHFLEIVCEIVRRIQTNDMTEMAEDIESQLSDVEAANINVSWIRAHFEAFLKRNEAGKKYSSLMEMKSNTILVKAAAQKDLRERCDELVAAQELFKKAERCVRVLHLVEKNINENILESKGEIDSWVNHPVV